MADFVSFDDLFRVARDEALIRNGQLSRDAVERAGSDANVLLAGGCAAADEVVGQIAQVEAGLFLDSATGAELDRLVFDRYGLLRKQAAAAVGQVEFVTVVNNPAPFSIPSGTLLQTAAGVQFSVTAAATFPAGTTGPITAFVRSLLAGSDQQAEVGTITSILGQLPGSPADLTVNNALATAGADDAEDDPSLRGRARLFFVTARRGTKAAIIAGALAVPGVRTASLFEVLSSTNEPARAVQLIISDAFTVALAGLATVPPTYAAQSSALALTVFLGLDDVRAAGINVTITVGVVKLLPIILHLTFNAGVDPAAVTASAKAVAVSYTNALSPGQVFSVLALQNLLRAITGLFYTGNEVSSPNGDVVPGVLEVLRTSPEIVTAPAV